MRFTITPRDTWWWSSTANGWDQTAGTYRLYVWDSSALNKLPVRLAFPPLEHNRRARGRVIAPRTLVRGKAARVSVRLTRGGTARLSTVRLSLQLPQGFTSRRLGPATFRDVPAGRSLVARFGWFPPG